jgi:hypothetical protein
VIVPTMDGCIPQWYANVPRVDIVTGAADAPAVMLGVVNELASWMMSCVLVSAFFQITRCPRLAVVGLGTNELLPLIPVMLMVRSAAAGGVVVVVVVGVDGLELPHAALSDPNTATIAMSFDVFFIRIPRQGMYHSIHAAL